MDVKCLILPGLLVGMLLALVIQVKSASWSHKREMAHQAWLNNSMKNSKMVQPVPVEEPVRLWVEERYEVPVESSAEAYVREMNERKQRQQEQCAKQRQKRAEKRMAKEKAQRIEMDAIIQQAYESLRQED